MKSRGSVNNREGRVGEEKSAKQGTKEWKGGIRSHHFKRKYEQPNLVSPIGLEPALSYGETKVL